MGFPSSTPASPSPHRPLRVLVAEDEAVNRMTALALLRRAGHSVVTVEDGPSAVDAATGGEGGGFDVLLMDLGLPGFDGDEAVRRIRSHPNHNPRLRILMLTASATPDGLSRCQSCGADGVLTKPLQLEALEAALAGAPAVSDRPAPNGRPIDHAAIATMRGLLPADRVAALTAKTAVTLRTYRADLDSAWNEGDARQAGAMAHKIAGVSGQYGCVALRRAAQGLEAVLETQGLVGEATISARQSFDAAYGPALAYLDGVAAGG